MDIINGTDNCTQFYLVMIGFYTVFASVGICIGVYHLVKGDE